MAILEVKDLVKHYHSIRAVDGVSFAIEQGVCFGLLGPNGAGKTTTIEIIEGIQPPSSGVILYKNRPIGRDFHQEVGIQFQHTALQEFLTVLETVTLFQKLYHRSLELDKVVALCSLQDILQRDVHKLSGGQRQRLLLALALINDPEILFLDEPTTGLDPHSRQMFWKLIEGIKSEKTIILTTHYMEEASYLCDEIAIMDKGRIIVSGEPRALLASHFSEMVITLPEEEFSSAPPDLHFHIKHGLVMIQTADVAGVIDTLTRHKINLSKIQIRARTLEDLFLELTEINRRNP